MHVAYLGMSLGLVTFAGCLAQVSSDDKTDETQAAVSSRASFGVVEGVDANGFVNGWMADYDCSGNAGSAPDGFCEELWFTYDAPYGSTSADGWYLTDVSRPDVAAVYGGNGQDGFRVNVPAAYLNGARHTVYAYSDENTGHPVTLFAQSTFSVLARAPIGVLDGASASSVNGWAFDPDTSWASSYVTVVFESKCSIGEELGSVSILANDSRPDVDAAYGISGNHGFHYSPVPEGTHCVTVHAYDTGNNSKLEKTIGIRQF